jgi:hypothetical protein
VQLLIAGIPGTGKSAFSRWLAENHGFAHFDVDWQSHQRPMEDWLTEPLLVIDWGFPVSQLGTVRSLVQRGVSQWWFDGDRDAALASFLARRTVSKLAWDAQIAAIDAEWANISAVFDHRIIDVISDGPAFMDPDAIFHLISQ